MWSSSQHNQWSTWAHAHGHTHTHCHTRGSATTASKSDTNVPCIRRITHSTLGQAHSGYTTDRDGGREVRNSQCKNHSPKGERESLDLGRQWPQSESWPASLDLAPICTAATWTGEGKESAFSPTLWWHRTSAGACGAHLLRHKTYPNYPLTGSWTQNHMPANRPSHISSTPW